MYTKIKRMFMAIICCMISISIHSATSSIITKVVQALKNNSYIITSQGKSKVKAHQSIYCNNAYVGTKYIKIRKQRDGSFKVREVKPQLDKPGLFVTEQTIQSEDALITHIK